MKARALLLAVVLLALGASSASANTTIVSSNPIYQPWVDAARVPTPDVTLTVVESRCPELVSDGGDFARACTTQDAFTIWDADTYEPRHTFLHELGHNFDFYVLPTWARERFEALIDDTRAWDAQPNAPQESFAEAYARCAVTGAGFRGDPNLLLRPHWGAISGRAYRAICRMMVKVG